MRVLVTGSSGLIGSALAESLEGDGHEVRRLKRGPQWDAENCMVDPAVLDSVDVVVNLAGAGLGDHRWSDEHKRRVRDSRINGTLALATAIAEGDGSVKTFVNGSAIGFYGDAGDTAVTEESPAGEGFLSTLCVDWEAASEPAKSKARVVLLRTGIVLSPKGGALKKQLPIFKAGGGGKLGSGRQWQSWISIDDEVGAIRHAIDSESVHGPVNAAAPNPVTNAEFTKALGRALKRPAVLAIPPFALRVAFGADMTREMLLAGQRVVPAKLEATGYTFRHAELDQALEALL